MKKISLIFLTLILTFTLFTGCGKEENSNKIKIGVSPVPHSEIIEFIKDDLEKDGVEVEIVEFTDYIIPNKALDDKDIDANFFQHEPYMNDFREKEDLDIVSLGAVHIEPMGLFSTKHDNINDLKDGSTIAIPNDATNGGRALLLLEQNGLIKLDDKAGLLATENDIVENPKNLEIEALEAAQLPRVLNDLDGAIINGNYALEADLVPTEDALILEEKDSPFANIIAIRKGEENEEKFKILMKHIQSDKVKKFIEDNYEGTLIPAF
ncbi:MAG TPA: MetQ/NlpA family ABC transporter substrate-binding protein [Tissierellales bacterium]|nr:MetQ/NlpA family ABC transporter substrate-binding protein [Tissierellales bacterium]